MSLDTEVKRARFTRGGEMATLWTRSSTGSGVRNESWLRQSTYMNDNAIINLLTSFLLLFYSFISFTFALAPSFAFVCFCLFVGRLPARLRRVFPQDALRRKGKLFALSAPFFATAFRGFSPFSSLSFCFSLKVLLLLLLLLRWLWNSHLLSLDFFSFLTKVFSPEWLSLKWQTAGDT